MIDWSDVESYTCSVCRLPKRLLRWRILGDSPNMKATGFCIDCDIMYGVNA